MPEAFPSLADLHARNPLHQAAYPDATPVSLTEPAAGPVTYVVTPVDRVRQEGPGTVAR